MLCFFHHYRRLVFHALLTLQVEFSFPTGKFDANSNFYTVPSVSLAEVSNDGFVRFRRAGGEGRFLFIHHPFL
jgi:hypothetical protein